MSHNPHDDILIISENEAGLRLDKILAQRFEAIHSRTYFQKLIEENHVLLNGLPAKKRNLPQAGDEIAIHFVVTPEIGLEPEAIPLDIVYEDDHLIIVNKPVGMVVHPAVGNWTGTFVNALLYHCKELFSETKDNIRPGIVHRLDKDTSGLLVAAKTSLAHQRLIALFSSRNIHKEYLAICLGNPGNIVINQPIGRHPVNRQQMAVIDEGKPAISHVKTLAFDGKISLVQVILETGRTHQIRVHLKYLGTPVLGDTLYGNTQVNAKYGAKRHLLHAHRLVFKHPITDKKLEVEVELPQDMKEWSDKLQKRKL